MKGKQIIPDPISSSENLPERELNFHSLFTAMTEGVAIHQMIYDASGKAVDYVIRDVNPSFEKNLGIPVDKAKGALATQLFGLNPPPYIDIYEHVVKTGEPYYFTSFFQPLKKHFEISVFMPREDWFATVFLDITGTRNAIEELRLTSTKYRRLYESMMNGFARTDMEGNIKEFNSYFREMLGYSESELQQMTYLDITPVQWHEYEKRIIRNQVIPNGYSEVYEKEYQKKDSSVFPVELRISLIRDETGKPEGMWASVRDITDRKVSEQELERMIDKFNLATRSGNMGVWEWLVNTDKLDWDDKMFELYEVDKNNFPGNLMAWESVLHPDDLERIREDVKLALSGEKEFDCEFRVIHPNGSIHYLKAYAQVVWDSGGNPLWMTGINFDITYRKKLDIELMGMNVILEEKVEQKTKELQERVVELERFYKATIDRELRMKEMRMHIEELESELKKYNK